MKLKQNSVTAMKIAVAASLACASLASFASADGLRKEFVPAKAKWLAHVDVEGIRRSKTASSLSGRMNVVALKHEAEIDELMTRTNAGLLGLCLDTGHIKYAGGDPLAVLARHAARIWHVHFKDCDDRVADRARAQKLGYLAAVKSQLFCELGRGAVDFASVIATLQARRYDGWIVVEQDVFPGYGTPKESAARSRAFLHRLGI